MGRNIVNPKLNHKELYNKLGRGIICISQSILNISRDVSVLFEYPV